MPLVDGFSWGSPVSPPLHSGVAPYSPRFTLDDSQDLDVKSRSNLFTHSVGIEPATLRTGTQVLGHVRRAAPCLRSCLHGRAIDCRGVAAAPAPAGVPYVLLFLAFACLPGAAVC
ncbi:hypothetical protein PR048_016943 [Dryococelus australis]|uniref:Uncharacterized protein n=1 Tax=Dryococelus australis TaxID=614101 RepID=A0ABQ9H843_9NEOP|nr:hypothetical protein PR048_016943 [Dryococelus australis]